VVIKKDFFASLAFIKEHIMKYVENLKEAERTNTKEQAQVAAVITNEVAEVQRRRLGHNLVAHLVKVNVQLEDVVSDLLYLVGGEEGRIPLELLGARYRRVVAKGRHVRVADLVALFRTRPFTRAVKAVRLVLVEARHTHQIRGHAGLVHLVE